MWRLLLTLGALVWLILSGSAHATLALDGSATDYAAAGGATTYNQVNGLTTTSTNDVIIAAITANMNVGSSVTVAGCSLSWSTLSTIGVASGSFEGIFYAVAASTLSACKPTWTSSSGNFGFTSATLFGVSGADTSSIFDPNAGLPATSTSGTTLSFSNTNSPSFAFGCARYGFNNPAPGGGWTGIASGNAGFWLCEYQPAASPGTLSLSEGGGQTFNGAIASYINQAPAAPAFTLMPQICLSIMAGLFFVPFFFFDTRQRHA